MNDAHTQDKHPGEHDDTGSAFETCDFRADDVPEIIQVFRDAIHVTGSAAYAPEQLAAWARKGEDEAAFAAALNEGWVRIAVDDEGIVGFAQINLPGHIEMLFTAPRVARRGVATLLMDDMLALGEAMGAQVLTTDASEIARGFFEYFGFVSKGPETVERHGVSLIRYPMQRSMKRPRK